MAHRLLPATAPPWPQSRRWHSHAALRLSSHFVPTLRRDSVEQGDLPSLQLLLRGGYIRQSSSGIYTLLPNALRILSNVERIVHREMASICASQLAMPTLLSSALWRRTGRYQLMGSELYRLQDRNGSEFVLGPTHEEEVTRLVGASVASARDLPLRLYQITRKHRDEPRPRMGLLRTREFTMKDLYTFDADLAAAEATYVQVRGAYQRIFDAIFGPGRWKSAQADSGAIGGSNSHEYHVQDPVGEDTLLACTQCEYAANEERATAPPAPARMPALADEATFQLYGSPDPHAHQLTLHVVVFASGRTLNPLKLAKALPAAEPELELLFDSRTGPTQLGGAWDWSERPEGPLIRFDRVAMYVDSECVSLDAGDLESGLECALAGFARSPQPSPLAHVFPSQFAHEQHVPAVRVDLRTAEHGDVCPACRAGTLHASRAIEVGHTFLLGERYSRALDATVGAGGAPLQMGCYGIGVSRILGALAQRAAAAHNALAPPGRGRGRGCGQDAGLVWPHALAPFQAVVVTAGKHDPAREAAATAVADTLAAAPSVREALRAMLGLDPTQTETHTHTHTHTHTYQDVQVALDDRPSSLGSKLADADLTGYPARLILGAHYDRTRQIELRILSSFLHPTPHTQSNKDEAWETHFIQT